MPPFETKLKLGRKLKDVESATASNNQASALFRYDEAGGEEHVSLSIESDTMTVDDVIAVFQLLHDRGVLVASACKTWVNQPTASKARFGETTTWQDVDLEERTKLLRMGLKTRTGGPAGPGPGASRAALVKLAEVERKLAEVKAALKGDEEGPQAERPAEELDAMP